MPQSVELALGATAPNRKKTPFDEYYELVPAELKTRIEALKARTSAERQQSPWEDQTLYAIAWAIERELHGQYNDGSVDTKTGIGTDGNSLQDHTLIRTPLNLESGAQDAVVAEPNLMDGFWADPPYLGTQETWTYPDLHLVLERYTIDTETSTRQFWNWMQCLSPQEVSAELAATGFGAPAYFGDVAGTGFEPSAPTFTVLTRRTATTAEPTGSDPRG